MKNDNFIGIKYKISLDVHGALPIINNKGIMILQEDHISLKITDSMEKDMVMRNLKPIHMEGEDTFLIKYALIKKILASDKKFRIELFNPSILKSLYITVNQIEGIGLLLNRSLGIKAIYNIVNYIKIKSQNSKKILIEQFIFFINMLGKEVESNVIQYVSDDKFFRGINESKKYYDKSMLDLRELDRKKLKFSKQIISRTKRTPMKNVDEVSDLDMFNNIISDYSFMRVYSSYENVYNEIKTRASLMIDESIFLLLNIINVEPSKLKKIDKSKIALELKNLYSGTESKVNKSDICVIKNLDNRINREFDRCSSFSTNTNSIKDKKLIDNKAKETPKFRGSNEEVADNKMTHGDIMVKIDEIKNNHTFCIPDCKENILHNAIEIIYRKFFEHSLDEFFPKLFIFEKDTKLNYDFLKLDSLFSYFMYLKNLKAYLFTFENKIHFADLFFLD